MTDAASRTAPSIRGNEYRRTIARYLLATYGPRGLQIYEEVPLGTSMIGKQRRIDLLLRLPTTAEGGSDRVLALECKYQDSSGTVDEKIPYALQDLAALRVPAALCYGGTGFSTGVLHLLQGSALAAYCLPDRSLTPLPRRAGEIDSGTWQLDHIVAITFGWWDVILGDRRPFGG